jgi:hypothetical protein
MRVIKTDGRYNFHKQGFHTILEFNMKVRHQRDNFFQVKAAVERVFGEVRKIHPTKNCWVPNENYRVSLNSDRKHRRIHLRDEQQVTLVQQSIWQSAWSMGMGSKIP